MGSMKGMTGNSYTRAFPVAIIVHALAVVLLWIGWRMMPAPVKELEYIECQMVECEPEKEPVVPEKKVEVRKPEPPKPVPPKPEPPKPEPPKPEPLKAEPPRPQPVPQPAPKPVVEAPRPEPAPAQKVAEAPAPVVAAPPPRPAAPVASAAPSAPPVAAVAAPAPGPSKPEVYEKGAAGIVTAVLVHKVEPFYPLFERRNEIEGKVGVKFLVMEDGTVADVSVIKSSGSNNFDESAVKAVKQWKFKPAKKGEKSVRMLIKQYVVFKLEE